MVMKKKSAKRRVVRRKAPKKRSVKRRVVRRKKR